MLSDSSTCITYRWRIETRFVIHSYQILVEIGGSQSRQRREEVVLLQEAKGRSRAGSIGCRREQGLAKELHRWQGGFPALAKPNAHIVNTSHIKHGE